MPSLELCVSCSESFSGLWISVVIIASSTGSKVLNFIMVISLIAFANDSHIRSCGYARDGSFLRCVSSLNVDR